ncbi:MAG: hypothetical protein M1834_000016 [Cirrosporium novae-zelandiae]|nr:MAG: hypothetical protein M1834_000016 [Cirrosporium novae-zelandiae]
MDKTNTPCEVCRGAIERRQRCFYNTENEFQYDHHKTPQSLRTSSDMGCHICATMWRSLSGSQRNRVMMEGYCGRGFFTNLSLLDAEVMAPGSSEYQDIVFLVVAFGVGLGGSVGDETRLPSVMFLMLPDRELINGWWSGTDIKEYNHDEVSEYSTGSEASLALMMRWFRQCVETHTRCNMVRKNASDWYPTRLIDLGNNSEKDIRPRLIVTRNVCPEGPYVTLSHRWGSAKFLQLKKECLKNLQNAIPSSELPKTFLDAMAVSRRLGVRYIWIDSLCIIQNNRDDWLREASLMHQVYSNSFCNISATGATDSSTGLFKERAPHFLHPCTINMSWKGSPLSQYQVEESKFWTSHVGNAPLNQRAWVVQERLLAPRIIHFGSQQLLWECCELDAAEKYPHKLPPTLASGQAFYKILDPLVENPHPSHDDQQSQNDPPENENTKINLYHGWYRILEAYTKSHLTNPSDKLIALSGIAKQMAQVLRDDYIAGLWKSHLPVQLLWFIPDDISTRTLEPSRPASLYRAPSFSWASLDAAITPGWFTEDWDGGNQLILAEALDVSIETETADTTGAVKGGAVCIRGMLKTVRLDRMATFTTQWDMTVDGVPLVRRNDQVDRQQQEQQEQQNQDQEKEEEEIERFSPQVMLDLPPPLSISTLPVSVSDPPSPQQTQTQDHHIQSNLQPYYTKPLYILPIEAKLPPSAHKTRFQNKQHPPTPISLMGLLLSPVVVEQTPQSHLHLQPEPKPQSQFHRIGVWSAHQKSHIQQLLPPLRSQTPPLSPPPPPGDTPLTENENKKEPKVCEDLVGDGKSTVWII